MERLAETGPVKYIPTEDEYKASGFVYTSYATQKYGKPTFYASTIDDLPTDSLVIGYDAARRLTRLIARPWDFHRAGFSETPKAPPKQSSNYSEYSEGLLQGRNPLPLLTVAGEKKLGWTIMEGQRALHYPELLRASDKSGTALKQAAANSFDLLVESNLLLAASLSYGRLRLQPEEAFQEACIGLMHAASKFDYRKEVKFGTYATRWINQHIQAAIAKKYTEIKLKRDESRMLNALRDDERVYGNFEQNPREEVMARLGISSEQLDEVLNNRLILAGPLPLEVPHSETNLTVADHLVDEKYDVTNGLRQAVEGEPVIRTFLRAARALPKPYGDVFRDYVAEPVLTGFPVSRKIVGARYNKSAEWISAAAKTARWMLMHPSMGLIAELDDSKSANIFKKAACRGLPVEVFMEVDLRYNVGANDREQIIEDACGSCAVRSACSEFARDNNIIEGYWGDVKPAKRVRKLPVAIAAKEDVA